MSSNISGMAASIRSASESETFDLAGQNVTTITNTIQSAFRDPLPTTEMVRITFVTGAGKLGRQKYDDGAAKAVTSSLRELGFEDDRGASCVVECAGSFKLQHDTGKNLKTVVVFPNITLLEDAAGELNLNDDNKNSKPLLEEGSPESLIAMSSSNVFDRMITSKCPSWSQKKGCMTAIESLMSQLKSLDEKLMCGTPLNDAEQDFYDAVSLDTLEEKEALVKKKMLAQVESGHITRDELNLLINQVSERLTIVSDEISESNSKPKKLQKLKAVKEKTEQRQSLLKGIAPQNPHRLRHEAEIHKLLSEMAPLQKLEDESGGRLLSIKETQMMGKKHELEDKVLQLEDSCRGWFEDDDFFHNRLQISRDAFNAKQKTVKKKSKGSTATKTAIPRWVTPGQTKSATSKSSTKPKKKKGTSSVFAAMMIDSDSD